MAAAGCEERNESMPPKLDAKSKTERVHFVAPRSLLDRVEEWRAQQRPLPSLSVALRTLIEERLTEYETKKGPTKGEGSD